MTISRFAIFALWSVGVIAVTGVLLFIFTFGDCFQNEACLQASNRSLRLIVGSAFIIYWAVAIGLFRRWSR